VNETQLAVSAAQEAHAYAILPQHLADVDRLRATLVERTRKFVDETRDTVKEFLAASNAVRSAESLAGVVVGGERPTDAHSLLVYLLAQVVSPAPTGRQPLPPRPVVEPVS